MTLTLVQPGELLPLPLVQPTSLFELFEEGMAATLGLLGQPALEVRVAGVPGPQGSKDPLGVSKTGKLLMRESSRKVKPWRENVTAAALSTFPSGWTALRGPVVLAATFVLQPPARMTPQDREERRGLPSTTPDLDKLVRSTADALTAPKPPPRAKNAGPLTDAEIALRAGLLAAGVYKDDGQVCDVIAAKRYVNGRGDVLGHQGALIRVWPLP